MPIDIDTSIFTTTTARKYKDIDLSFEAKPSGDIYTKVESNAVQQSIETLLLAGPDDCPFQPNFGAGIQDLLFEQMDDATVHGLRSRIYDAIATYEPRANVHAVEVFKDEIRNSLDVEIEFSVVNTTETVTFTTTLSRIR